MLHSGVNDRHTNYFMQNDDKNIVFNNHMISFFFLCMI